MKIAIVGTHGTGKSTLSYLLASHYKKLGKNVKIIQEVARSCPFKINDGMSPETAQWIYYEHARKEMEAEAVHDIIIGDRSVYDSFVYAEHFKQKNSMVMLLEQVARVHLRRYDKLIFVRPDLPLETDGIRSPDVEFQKGIDVIFERYMTNVKHVQIKSSQIFDKEETWKHFCL